MPVTSEHLLHIMAGMREGISTRQIYRDMPRGCSEDSVRLWRMKLAKQGHVDNYEPKAWSAADAATLRQAIKEKRTAKEISEMLGRSPKAVVRYMSRHGYAFGLRPDPWTSEEIEMVHQMWNEGHSASDIATRLGRSKNGVEKQLTRHELRRYRQFKEPEIKRSTRTDCYEHLLDLIQEFSGVPRKEWEWSGPLRVELRREALAEYRAKCVKPEEEIPLSDKIRLANVGVPMVPVSSYVGSTAAMCADFG